MLASVARGRLRMKAVREPASLPLFHGELWLARLRRHVPAMARHFPPGHVLARPGQPLATVHVVVSGVLSVASTSRAGRRAVMALVGPHGVLGQEAVLPVASLRSAAEAGMGSVGPEVSAVDIRAVLACTTLVFGPRQLSECAARDPLIALWLAASLSERVRLAERALARALSLPVRDRVLDLLQELAERHGTPTAGGVRVHILLSQDDIGAMVGATRESVNRAFRGLMNSGAVRRENGLYVVCRPGADQPVGPGIS